MRVSVQAPAKVNLALHVTGRRADGYHDIETLAVFAGVCDRIGAQAAATDSFAICGPFGEALSREHGNLVLRARDVLRRAAEGRGAGPVSIELEKNLPLASGIGGGSADAAAALLALARLWDLPASIDLAAVGAQLGADVPMCLASQPLLATGVGEKIAPVELPSPLHAVLVNPGIAVPTKDVFAALARRDNAPMAAMPATGFNLGWLGALRNDLQEPAISGFPLIGEVLRRLAVCEGIALARMSGSGATCFGLFASAALASAAAAAIGRSHPGWWCVATQLERGEYPARIETAGA